MDKILNKNNLGKVLSYEKLKMKEALKELLTNKKIFNLDKQQVEKYNRKNVFKPIVKAIKEL